MAVQPVYKSKNITMCSDGKYRWVYELDMYKSMAIIKWLGGNTGIPDAGGGHYGWHLSGS